MSVKKLFIFLLGLIILSLLGCTKNYLYTSKGTLKYSSGDELTAVLYWKADEGRLYYGKKYSEKDSGITLRICNRTPKSFEPLDTNTHTLVLLSKAMDHKVAKADEDGNVILLNKIVVLKAGEVCGEIYISDNKASMDNLLVGNIPAIAFLCKNITRINRYPLVGKYEFKPIEKTDSASLKGSGPNPCNL